MLDATLKYAVHYNEIINYDYKEDLFTKRIIESYKVNILKNIDNKYKVKSLDMIVYKYIDDYGFKVYVKNKKDLNIDYYYNISKSLSKLFHEYKQNRRKGIIGPIWL